MRRYIDVFKNSGWLFIDRSLRALIGFYISIRIANYLGVSQFGTYNLALSLFAILLPFASLGLNNIFIREFVKNSLTRNSTFFSSLILKLIGSLITVFIALIIYQIFPHYQNVSRLTLIMAIGIPFLSFDIIELSLQALLKSRKIVFIKLIAFIISSITKLLVIYLNMSILYLAWAITFDFFLSGVILFSSMRLIDINIRDMQIDFSKVKGLFIDSFPLLLSGFMVTIYMRIDQLMLGYYIDEQAVGVYSIAVRFTELWYIIPTVLISSFLPKFTEIKKQSNLLFFNEIQNLYKLFALISLITCLFINIFSTIIIDFLFNQEYNEASIYLNLLIWSIVFTNLGMVRSIYLTVYNKTKFHFYTVFIGAFFNMLLNLILIPFYQVYGAIFATIISYAIAAFGTTFFFKSLRSNALLQLKAIVLPFPKNYNK
ncbi:MAG: flippase [Flavobacteriales bacterium]|nr:flippase [Flavobacteriales bacterium]MCB9364759.1 flippase [Flavobacteriales bacterium]